MPQPQAPRNRAKEGPSFDRAIASAAEFGAAVRRRRKQLGHTQVEAAALCRVGVRFLSELERGKPTAEIGRALRVAQRLGLRLFALPRDVALVPGKHR